MGASTSNINIIHAYPVAMDPTDQTPIFRSPKAVSGLIAENEPMDSIYELFFNSYMKFPDRTCLGTKTLISSKDDVAEFEY